MKFTDKICPKIEKIDEGEKILIIEKGEIDLINFIKLRAEKQIEFSLSEISYEVITLFEFEITLIERNIFLCDLKP